ncbi:MAG TPA: hypothetical protein DEA47_00985 [Peptococcaceae bacterium]|nr:MAG: hypothetical protein XD50_0290 [Clostridia bacterium 41_269]HBT19939.1 hypothetical protein [Peptococcaceae bacterium]
MKKGISTLVLLSFLLSLVPLPVHAAEKEQLIKQEVILAYFDIWSQDGIKWDDTNNDGKPDKPGDRKTETFPYFFPEELLSQYTLTRVEVIEPPPVTREWYEKAGGRPYLLNGEKGELPWDDFNYWCNGWPPQNPRASARLADPERGKAEVTWSFTLHENPRKWALDLTDGTVRRVFGLKDPPYPVWTEENQGWRWVMPAVLLWYGIPKKLPDLYVADLDPGTEETQGGETYTGTVVFGLKDTYDKPVKARLSLTHNGYPITSVNGKIETFEPGEEKEFEFEFTGIEGEPSTLYAKIEPYDIEGDADWEDNEMEITIDPAGVDTGTSRLTFQAVSQNRKITRPENTAKWTDWVTATLRPKKPTPPRGTIVSWHITSATLTYPKNIPISCTATLCPRWV